MMQLLIISGKGGTGKTSLVASLAYLAKELVLADCDVDAPNLHLLIKAQRTAEQHPFAGTQKARIDKERCLYCGRCEDVCRFDAIHQFQVDVMACEGCGACTLVCPVDAIKLHQSISGEWFVSETDFGPIVHAQLVPGEEASGKLVTQVRQAAAELANGRSLPLVIIDGPPGLGCPVISSISGVDLALAVAEPTNSGLHDLKRLTTLASHFGVPMAVIINKYDLALPQAAEIESWCQTNKISVIGRLPYDETVPAALNSATPPILYPGSRLREELEAIWTRLSRVLEDSQRQEAQGE